MVITVNISLMCKTCTFVLFVRYTFVYENIYIQTIDFAVTQNENFCIEIEICLHYATKMVDIVHCYWNLYYNEKHLWIYKRI